MRPVDKGAAPNSYTKYQDAGPDLKSRLGEYCSYCERHIETHLAVEHIQPKELVPALKTTWSNFLLACSNCNSCKGHTPITVSEYFWPDIDNTLNAFNYSRGGIITSKLTLSPALQTKANNTIRLLGLDRDPGNPGRISTPGDGRWQRRKAAWQRAEKYCVELKREDTPSIREKIVDYAVATGMFSIWWTVFTGDIDMRRRLRAAFVGTHAASFDANENLVSRVGGQL